MPPSEGRVRDLVASAATALGAAAFSWTPLGDRDWPWHLADYQRMVTERALPWEDRFSWASEGDFLPVHWVFELVLGSAHAALGVTGIALVRAGLVALAFFALHRALRGRGLGPIASSGVALTVAALSRSRFLERPHLVTLLGVIVAWHLLVEFRDKGKKHLWPLLGLVLVWANSHPGVVYASILLGGFALAELARVPFGPELGALPWPRAQALAAWCFSGIAVTCLTPVGARLYPYLLAHSTMQKQRAIAELRPLDFTRPEDFGFAGALLVAAIILIIGWLPRRTPGLEGRRVRPDLTESLGALGFIVLAIKVARETNLALAVVAIAVAPVLAALVREAKDELADKDRGLHIFAWAFALLLGFGFPTLVLVSSVPDMGGGIKQETYPVREADWILKEKPAGRLWNTNSSGGYLLWRLDPLAHPDWKVATDGRQPLFERFPVFFAPVEERYAPNLIVIDSLLPWPIEEKGNEILARFALVHFSDGGRTYVRRAGPNARFVEKAYRSVWFRTDRDPTSRYGLKTTIEASSEDPIGARRELEAGVLAEEPDGHWGNLALAQVLRTLGERDAAIAAARKALAAKPRSADARELVRTLERR